MCFVCPSVPLFRTSKRPAGSTDTEEAVKTARTSSICFNEWFFLVLWISEIFILFWENIVGCMTQEPTKAVVPRPDSSLSGWQGLPSTVQPNPYLFDSLLQNSFQEPALQFATVWQDSV